LNWEKFNEIWDSVYVVQDRDELFWLVNKVESLNPKAIIEIGVEKGGTLKFWERVLPPRGLLVGIDRMDPEANVGWDWKSSGRDIALIHGDSADTKTIIEVARFFSYTKADFLFIDATHTNEAVKRDFENYLPFVRSGGLVGFHDINDVKGFFNSLQGRKEVNIKTIGTGVWWKP